MSVSIQNLTKIYGEQRAVDNISFTAEKGEIVGFLGPNGAGKSTTMKIATSYIPPTSGTVVVEGYDVTTHPVEVKRVTGYLPEHNPLYADLYVHEYLRFVAGLHGFRGQALRQRVAETVETCGLIPEQNKKIEALSKGYRQRVGLAQALVHDPPVLILDEPTSGLDPNQLVEIRKLIRDISRNKTVIFSTHIMQEVQALCDRVVVINKGGIVADDRLANLIHAGSGKVTLIVEFDQAIDLEMLRAISAVTDVSPADAGARFVYRVLSHTGVDLRADIFRFAADRKLSLLGLRQEENSLEQIFHTLTQSAPNQTHE